MQPLNVKISEFFCGGANASNNVTNGESSVLGQISTVLNTSNNIIRSKRSGCSPNVETALSTWTKFTYLKIWPFLDEVDDANVTVSMTSSEDEGTTLTDFSYVDVQIGISGVEIDTTYSGKIRDIGFLIYQFIIICIFEHEIFLLPIY